MDPMLAAQKVAMAVASVESDSLWSWHLKVDDYSLFRWYLSGTIKTHLRGCTAEQAEFALRRFVERSLKGELRITYLSTSLGPASEHGPACYKSKEIA